MAMTHLFYFLLEVDMNRWTVEHMNRIGIFLLKGLFFTKTAKLGGFETWVPIVRTLHRRRYVFGRQFFLRGIRNMPLMPQVDNSPNFHTHHVMFRLECLNVEHKFWVYAYVYSRVYYVFTGCTPLHAANHRAINRPTSYAQNQHLINPMNPICLNSFRIKSAQSSARRREH